MWGKWIGCRVPAAERGHFSAAQGAWSTISDQPGLVGQMGGWDPATGRAHLPALRSRATPESDLQSMTGHVLPLEAAWHVLPQPRERGGPASGLQAP